MNTNLQDTRQNADAATNLAATTGYSLSVGSNTPSVLQLNELFEKGMAAKNSMPDINPPSEEEIQHQMWMASGLVGFIAALVSGNAAGGIAGGMTAALAVHDHGYDLRQRSESVMELHNQGYTKQAILNWYETGDNKELDKERDNMQKMESEQISINQFNATQNQQERFHTDAENDARLNRAQQLTIANQAHLDRQAATTATGDAAERADRRLDKQEQQQVNSSIKDTIKGPQQKLYYTQMASKAMKQLKKYVAEGDSTKAAGAYENVRVNLTRAQAGGGAMLTEDQIAAQSGMPSYLDEKANTLGVLANGMPTTKWINSKDQQVKDDIVNEQENIRSLGRQAYDSLVATGHDPARAHDIVTTALIGTAIGDSDWSKEDKPEGDKSAGKSGQPLVSPGGVSFTVEKAK